MTYKAYLIKAAMAGFDRSAFRAYRRIGGLPSFQARTGFVPGKGITASPNTTKILLPETAQHDPEANLSKITEIMRNLQP